MLRFIGLRAWMIAFCLPCAAMGQSVPSPTKMVRVKGVADIVEGQVAAARLAAIRSAQKLAIEQTAGVSIEAAMEDKAVAVTRGGVSKFRQSIKQRILTRADGFLRGFRVVGERRVGDQYEVSLSVEVDDERLKLELRSLAQLLSLANMPKFMFVVEERVQGQDGEQVVVVRSMLESLLESSLLEKGFGLISSEHVQALQDQEAQSFEEMFDDDRKAVAFARRLGADFVALAQGKTRFLSYDDLGAKEFHGYSEVELKVLDATNGTLVASVKESGNTPANAFSMEQMCDRGMKKLAPRIIGQLISRTVDHFARQEKRGVRYSIRLRRVKSFRKQGRAFLNLLTKLKHVTNVKRLSFRGGRLEAELFYPLVRSTNDLERSILNASRKSRVLKTLELEQSQGKQMVFGL